MHLPTLITLLSLLTPLATAVAVPVIEAPEIVGKRSVYEENGVKRSKFEHRASGTTIDFVTNSGICETTPGVKQYSGYVNLGNNQSMWFWFFEARIEPKTAPLALWLNGGPGCSSLKGLFAENGPCIFKGSDTEPSLNPYSWNEYANMLYIDQPVGVGFSYGPSDVNSTVEAAPAVWKLLQAFFARFSEYQGKHFGLFTESYGGHYGPEFSDYFKQQNNAIAKRTIQGIKINMIALGLNNAWVDPYTHVLEYPNFLANNTVFPLFTQAAAAALRDELIKDCLPAIAACNTISGQDDICNRASNICNTVSAAFDQYYPPFDAYDPYDLRQHTGPSTFPSVQGDQYLLRPDVVRAIGARTPYVYCSGKVYGNFQTVGDNWRSFLSTLSQLVSGGLPTLIWAGDTDSVVDWFGCSAVANKIKYPEQAKFQQQALQQYKTNGKIDGEFKTVGSLSWLRVYDAGHTVPAFKPEMSLQVFKQMMQDGRICST